MSGSIQQVYWGLGCVLVSKTANPIFFAIRNVRPSCCLSSTLRKFLVVDVQRFAWRKAKYFAKERPLWCNNYNFPKGGWPGDPAGAQKCLHRVTPSHRSPMFNLGETCI